MREATPRHEQSRQQRNPIAQILEDKAKPRHDVQQQERNHQKAYEQDKRRIYRGADNTLFQKVRLSSIGDESPHGFGHRARLLACAHSCDIQVGKDARLRRERN